jgi:hypothetical protein
MQCDGKVNFKSYKLAEKVLQKTKDKIEKGQIYHCIECGFFHIGSAIAKRHGKPKPKVRREKMNFSKLLGEINESSD